MSFRYRMEPTDEQEAVMVEHCGQSRLIWNIALEQMNIAYSMGLLCDWKLWDLQLAELRNEPGFEWLKAGSSSMQQQALRQLRQAWCNFFANPGHFGRPKFRSKTRTTEGFVIRDVRVEKLNRKWSQVHVPKVGWVKFRRDNRKLEGYGMAHVTRDKKGRWHVSFSAPQPAVEHAADSSERVIGVDRNCANNRDSASNTLAISDGDASEMLSVPVSSVEEVKKLKALQKKLARQERGSRRCTATKRLIAKTHADEAARRMDWVEKISTKLVSENAVIVFEALQTLNMMASAAGTVDNPGVNVAAKSGLNAAIARQCWGMLVTRTVQKAEASGRTVLFVDPAYTSQTCSKCGYRHKKNRKGYVFKCLSESCGHTEHADTNAAKNIRAAGLAVLTRQVEGSECDKHSDTGQQRELHTVPPATPLTAQEKPAHS